MPQEPIRDPQLFEALEACRPNRDDLSDPGLSFLARELAASPDLEEVFTRLQRMDASIAEAFHELPVPSDLANRLLTRVCPSDPLLTVSEPAAAPLPGSARPASRVRRRYVVAGLAALAVGASLLVAVLVNRSGPLSLTAIQDKAVARFQSDLLSGCVGHLLTQQTPPSDRPFSRDLRADRQIQIRWRDVDNLLGQKTIAYDLSRAGGARATLYVLRYPGVLPSLPNSPPGLATPKTQNRSVAVWRKGALLYVLVVDGGPRVYRGFLDSSRPLI